MDGEIDAAHHQGRVEFLGEQPLAASLGQGTVDDCIARHLDDVDLDIGLAQPVRRAQQVTGLVRLGQRQRTAAGADTERLLQGHG